MGIVIDLETERIARGLKEYKSTGIVPKVVFTEELEIKKEVFAVSRRLNISNQKITLDCSNTASFYKIFENRKFDEDLENIRHNFKTNSYKFKFPTILSKYRRGINPVNALYNELQETLFKYKADCDKHVWIISLFKDQQFLNELISAIENDLTDIVQLENKYKNPLTTHVTKHIVELQKVKQNLLHYKDVFILVADMET